jgi:hypothetical protein
MFYVYYPYVWEGKPCFTVWCKQIPTTAIQYFIYRLLIIMMYGLCGFPSLLLFSWCFLLPFLLKIKKRLLCSKTGTQYDKSSRIDIIIVGASFVLSWFICLVCAQCSASLCRASDSITLLSLLLSWIPRFSPYLSTFL